MNLESIIERANRCARPGMDFGHPRSTKGSIARINEHFGITLPLSLVEFVRCWRASGSWFASLGPDDESEQHIIRINSYWRRRRHSRRIPAKLVIINLGFDEDFDCLDMDHFDPETGEYAIRYWSPETGEGEMHDSFPAYVDSRVRAWEGLDFT